MNQFDQQGFTAEGRALMNGTAGMTEYGMQTLTRTQGMTPYGVELTTGVSQFGGNGLLQQQHLLKNQRQDHHNHCFSLNERKNALPKYEPLKPMVPEYKPLQLDAPKYEPFKPIVPEYKPLQFDLKRW